MRRVLIALAMGLFVGVGGVVLEFSPLGTALERDVGLNWMFHLRGSIAPPDEVVVVGIDSRTGTQLGLQELPRDWPRSIHARLIEALNERGAAVIVFDIHFARPVNRIADQALVRAVASAGNVVLVERLSGKRQPIADASGRNVGMVWAEQLQPPFADLAAAAQGLATFPLPKNAAAVSDFWVFKESTDHAPTLPAVALQLRARGDSADLLDSLRAQARSSSPALVKDIEHAFDGAEPLRNVMRSMHDMFASNPAPRIELDTSPDGTAVALQRALVAMYAGEPQRLLNFYGPPGTVRNVPYHAVLKPDDPNVSAADLDFTGKVVFVGYSDLFDPGQPDRFYTVFTRDDGVDLSGVEIAATAYANLLTDNSLAPLDSGKTALLLLAFGMILGAAAFLLPGYVGVPVAFVVTAAYAYGALQMFGARALLVPVATPLLMQAPLALFLGLLGQYLGERRRGQRISAAINYYLPDELVRDLSANRLDQSKLNQVVYATCFATDMAGFSAIAERLPPRELAVFLNEYFETLAAPLKRHGVHVTEFRADAIMCAWTAEQASTIPRERALHAALDAAEAIKAFKLRHDMLSARLRIGLEVGFVYIGHAGGGGRYVYSIVGDSANTASRVEGLNKHIGTQILATRGVIEGVNDVLTRYVGDFLFVGKSDPSAVYEVVASVQSATAAERELCAGFATAMAAYGEGDWQAAARQFERLLAEHAGDGPTGFFLERCRRFIAEAPAAENPQVVRMDAK